MTERPALSVYVQMSGRLVISGSVVLETENWRAVDVRLEGEPGTVNREPLAARIESTSQRQVKVCYMRALKSQWNMLAPALLVKRGDHPAFGVPLCATGHYRGNRLEDVRQEVVDLASEGLGLIV
ncbi:MAG: hypothetical protein ACTHMZ_14255 [Actinomycetes bacterium]